MGVVEHRREPFGDQDLATVRAGRHIQTEGRGQRNVPEPGGEHHLVRQNMALGGDHPITVAIPRHPRDPMAGPVVDPQPLHARVQTAQQIERIHVPVMGIEGGADHLRAQ